MKYRYQKLCSATCWTFPETSFILWSNFVRKMFDCPWKQSANFPQELLLVIFKLVLLLIVKMEETHKVCSFLFTSTPKSLSFFQTWKLVHSQNSCMLIVFFLLWTWTVRNEGSWSKLLHRRYLVYFFLLFIFLTLDNHYMSKTNNW